MRLSAVADLVEGLHQVRQLAWQADAVLVTGQQVAQVMVDFEERSRRHQALLPVHLRAVDRQVRAAMGNCFGAPALARWDPRLADHELTSFDHYWWEVTRSYLEHVDACLQDWRLDPQHRHPTRLTSFHAWRQDEDVLYFAPTGHRDHPTV